MNGRQLTQRLLNDRYTRRTFRGVFPRDRLPLRVSTRHPSAYVINTDNQDGPGQHWVVVWFDGRGRGEYFDSYGLPPLHDDIESFILRHCRTFRCNQRLLQGVMSFTCWYFCVYHVLKKSRGFSMQRVLAIFHPHKLWANDRKVLSIAGFV